MKLECWVDLWHKRDGGVFLRQLLPWGSALIKGSDWIWRFLSCRLNGKCGMWKGTFYSSSDSQAVHPVRFASEWPSVCLSTRLGMGRVIGNVAVFWIPKNIDEKLGKNVKQQRGGRENAAAIEVKEDFLDCQTARALVIPSNRLRESGKIWKKLNTT